MERLTHYFEVGCYTEKQNILDISDKLPLFENGVIMGKAINSLFDFEDFMEEQGFDDINEIRAKLSSIRKINIENQKLKDRWNKLKEYVEVCKDDAPFMFNKMQELEKESQNER